MLTSSSHKVIRRSQTGSARPPAGKLTLQVQIPRFVDDARPQKKQPRQEYGGGLAYDEDSQEAPQPALKGGDGGQQLSSSAKLTVRFIVNYSGAGEIRDATLNMSLPPGVSAEPPSALLPPLRGTGGGGGGRGITSNGLGERGAENEPLVVAVLLTVERGTGFLPSSLAGKASVVYTRLGAASDGGSEPMSARCDLLLPLALVARVVETTKSGTHKFTFNTNQPPVPLSILFEDMSPAGADGGSPSDHTWEEGFDSNGAGGEPAGVGRGAGGGALGASGTLELIANDSTALSLRYWTVGPDAKTTKDVSVAVSKNSGRYRVQSESLPAAGLIATEVVRRLKDYFGESAERDRNGGSSVNGDKTRQAEGELLSVKAGEAKITPRHDDVHHLI